MCWIDCWEITHTTRLPGGVSKQKVLLHLYPRQVWGNLLQFDERTYLFQVEWFNHRVDSLHSAWKMMLVHLLTLQQKWRFLIKALLKDSDLHKPHITQHLPHWGLFGRSIDMHAGKNAINLSSCGVTIVSPEESSKNRSESLSATHWTWISKETNRLLRWVKKNRKKTKNPGKWTSWISF